jgi:hypothetical protein
MTAPSTEPPGAPHVRIPTAAARLARGAALFIFIRLGIDVTKAAGFWPVCLMFVCAMLVVLLGNRHG